MSARWLKLQTNWQDPKWLRDLQPEARLAWIHLLCHVKAHGLSGSVTARPVDLFAHDCFVSEEAVAMMLKAAVTAEELRETDGRWVIVNWSRHQADETGAQRQRRYREKQAGEESDACNASLTPVTPEERKREEKTGEEKRVNTPKPPEGSWTWRMVKNEFFRLMPESHHEDIKEFCDYHRDLKAKPWVRSTVQLRAEDWGKWPANRFSEAVRHTILMGWKQLAEPEAAPRRSMAPLVSGPNKRREFGAPSTGSGFHSDGSGEWVS